MKTYDYFGITEDRAKELAKIVHRESYNSTNRTKGDRFNTSLANCINEDEIRYIMYFSGILDGYAQLGYEVTTDETP